MERKPKLLPVRIYGDAILRKKALPVRQFDDKLHELVQDMIYTLYQRDGVGLAANQVGERKRLFVIDLDWAKEGGKPNPVVLINPVIEEGEGETEMEEGCISVPGVFAGVKRFSHIKYTYFDENGNEHKEEAEGYKAVVIQHEYDHLNGILFVDRLSKLALLRVKRKLNAIEKSAADGVNILTEIYRESENL
ncbi:MAG TPA: peptide deformylase [Candidatus Cloacimonadota bacterium]|nr:peptide deformylase [Candidatus Cloacimonadota bacterium]HQL14747.1 peptide deformylase [Candidatus Cloacimonadota bacterium]